MGKRDLSREALQDLYWNKGLSLGKIAEHIGMKSKNGVVYYMDKLGIVRRPSDRKNYVKNPFSENQFEKAYLLGLRAGDINAKKRHRTVAVYMTSTKDAQINMFKDVFERYAHVNSYEANGGFTLKTRKSSCHLDSSFDFLIEKPKIIPEWILNDYELFYSFLSGYCDSEASWILTEHKKYNGKWKDLIFSLGTCDKKILEQINQKLIEFGFNSHFYLVRKKGIYGKRKCNFDLYRAMMTKHSDVIRLTNILLPLSKHEDKINAMLRIINYGKQSAENKFLKKQNLGTIPMACIYCNNKKVWKNGFKKYKNKKYFRYKCPSCKREFQTGQIILGGK